MTRFYVGKPALPKHLIDREDEVKFIVDKMKNKSINYNVAVLGFRRIGKSSILFKVKDILSKNKKHAVVYFDVKENMAEPKLFLSRLEKKIFDAYIEKLSTGEKINSQSAQASKIFSKIRSRLSSKKLTAIGVNISAEGTISPKLEFDNETSDYSSLFLSVLQTPTAFAEKNKLKFIVILDEFQDLIELKNYSGLGSIFSLFRAIIQKRGDDVSFIVSGSRVHMLNNLLGNGGSPLFVHFEPLVVGDMDKKNSVILFKKYLQASKVSVTDEQAEEAYELVGGQPLYLMSLAEKWNGRGNLKDALNFLLTDPMGTLKLYADYVLLEDTKSVTGGPIIRTILRAISKTDTGYTFSELSKKIDVAANRLPRYMNHLVAADIVKKTKTGFVIRDRTIRQYLRLEINEIES